MKTTTPLIKHPGLPRRPRQRRHGRPVLALFLVLFLTACRAGPERPGEATASAEPSRVETPVAVADTGLTPTPTATRRPPATATRRPEPPEAPVDEAGRDPPAADTAATANDRYSQYDIITVLPRDAIPAIFAPEFFTLEEAEEYYEDQELVIGVAFNGQARAYSVPFLSGREIVNDTVGGVKIAVTW